MKRVKVLVVGSNPSVRSGSTIPFLNTKSLVTLRGWIQQLGEVKVFMANVNDTVTEDNAPLTTSQIRRAMMGLRQKHASVKPDKVVALGVTAAKALGMAGIDHFIMPHPSGLNFKLNDKEFLTSMLISCKEYIHGDQRG